MQEPVNPPSAPQPPRRPSVVGPVILIILGLAFLAQNLNLLDVNIWSVLWRLWPVWLIAVGLDLMLGRQTSWGTWVVLGLVLAIIGGAVWLDAHFGFAYGAGEPVSVSQPVGMARRAQVLIDTSVAELQINGGGSANLVEGTVIPVGNERIEQQANQAGDTLTFSLKSKSPFGINIPIPVNHQAPSWKLRLSDQIPMDLRINTGVGKSRIDLSRIKLTVLEVDTGVGETEITLPGEGRFRVEIDSGVGEVTLRFPEALAARIVVDKGIGDLRLQGAFFQEGRAYVTPHYGSTENQVEIEIDAGVGEVTIETF